VHVQSAIGSGARRSNGRKRFTVFGRRKKKDSGANEVVPVLARGGTGDVAALAAADASLDVSIEILDETDHRGQTVFAEDTRVTGTVQTASTMVIEGEVEGEITSSSTVYIAGDGTIKGNVSAQNLEICGRVDGEVRARRLRVEKTGRVLGNVTVDRLVIDEGGVLEGRCRMKKD
jgi:cytoskeletal protein CcmA (bactofilin family)